jgi:hypothetical protein
VDAEDIWIYPTTGQLYGNVSGATMSSFNVTINVSDGMNTSNFILNIVPFGARAGEFLPL